MPRLRFAKDFDYVPKGKNFGSMTHYPKGFEGDVPEAHASAALEGGHAEETKATTDKPGGEAPKK